MTSSIRRRILRRSLALATMVAACTATGLEAPDARAETGADAAAEAAQSTESDAGGAAQVPVGTAGDVVIDQAYIDERIQAYADSTMSRFMVSGYGTTGLSQIANGTTAFGIGFNPAFHFRMSDKLHFNAEFEMGYEVNDERESEFEIDLEFVQADYLATDWLAISAGRFLTPFNTFGPRLHPTWINKLSSAPPIYGGHEGGGFIPVMKSLGGMFSGGTALWNDDAKINYAFFVGNGPTGEDLSDPPTPDELVDLEFNNTPDLDDGVAFGGRMGLLPIANLEVGASFMTSNPDGVRFHLVGADAWYYYEGLELRGEWAFLKRDDDPVKAKVQGYWLQAAYRFDRLFPDRSGWRGQVNRLEPVVRWGQVLDSPEAEKDRDQVAVGLNYWLFPSAPLKLSYEVNNGAPDDNRFWLSFAYGF